MRPPTHPPRLPPALASRDATRAAAPADHHLWRNGRLWWIAITLCDRYDRRRRLRRSLGTDDVVEARRARDRFLARLSLAGHWTVAAPTPRLVGAEAGVGA